MKSIDIVEATREYEEWMKNQLAFENLTVDPNEIEVKHDEMAHDVFPFLRATFYRWAQIWPQGQLSWRDAPQLLAVGDLHVENFGTWRDSEGRFVWGINDFDEASKLPYTNDLIRLAVSAQFATEDLSLSTICDCILSGYKSSIQLRPKAHPAPLVLSEENEWLSEIATTQIHNPTKFWDKLDRTPSAQSKKRRPSPDKKLASAATTAPDGARPLESGDVPPAAYKAIKSQLPPDCTDLQWKRRQAGVGSLGRPRIVALGNWRGARFAREGKALLPSAVLWARGHQETESHTAEIIGSAIRCPDPHFAVVGRWLVRRLAPDCTRVELADLDQQIAEQLLKAMGRETANIHLGSSGVIDDVRQHLKNFRPARLEEAVQEYAGLVRDDYKIWRKNRKNSA